jgi:hypothetical protein
MFQWLFDQYLVAPVPYRLRSAKHKGDAKTPKGRTLRLDLSGGFDQCRRIGAYVGAYEAT